MRLGIDTGGTFTDAVLYDSKKGTVIKSAKSLTTHHNLIGGIRDVINQIDSPERPLAQCVEAVAVSTTLATNSIVEGRGGTICLLLIGHDARSLERAQLKTALRDDPVALIRGGHTAHGDENEPLDIEFARQSILEHAPAVTAFVVAGMFSVRNTGHELAVRNLVRELTDKPVTCTFELTANLDAPRRAVTAVLNARLIAPIKELIEAIDAEIAARSIDAPVMVVKGDGSMISAEVAIDRPVETILSGPAASIVGACTLAESEVGVVADIGGTTTDIAVLHQGAPAITRHGAQVGGFRTFVEAVDIHTSGIGGDSQVRLDKELRIGPNRCVPVSAICQQWPQALEVLKDQLAQPPQPHQGSFLLRRRSSEEIGSVTRGDQALWQTLASGPADCYTVFSDSKMTRAFERLRKLDLVQLASFTPTDALHVLGKMDQWSSQGAAYAAQMWVRGFERNAPVRWKQAEEFCQCVIEAVIHQSAQALIRAVIATEAPHVQAGQIGSYLLQKGLRANEASMLGITFSLAKTLSAVGAPAQSFYPQIAKKLNTNLAIAKHSEVGNAVGAAAGSIMQRVCGLITAPDEGVYRAHLHGGIEDFPDLELAASALTENLRDLAFERAKSKNSALSDIKVDRSDVIVNGIGGRKLFIESKITVTAACDLPDRTHD